MIRYSEAFTSPCPAFTWALRQLPLVSRHGCRLFVAQHKDRSFYVWKTECARDNLPLIQITRGVRDRMITNLESAAQFRRKNGNCAYAKRAELNIIGEVIA